MTDSNIKQLLSVYRPSGKDATEMAEALCLAQKDPVLQDWFNRELEFDATLAQRIHNILSGLKVKQSSTTQPVSWFYQPWIALAAALIIFIGVGGFWFQTRSAQKLEGWQTEALGTITSLLSGQSHFDQTSPDITKLQAWLNVKHAPSAQSLPVSLQTLESLGCKTLQWKGRTVSIICFNLGNDRLVHLVMIDQLQATLPENQPRFEKNGEWITASWNEVNTGMMLVTKGDRKNLEKFFL